MGWKHVAIEERQQDQLLLIVFQVEATSIASSEIEVIFVADQEQRRADRTASATGSDDVMRELFDDAWSVEVVVP